MGDSNTGYILTIFAFYGFIAVIMGLVGASMEGSNATVEYTAPTVAEPSLNPLTIFDYIGMFFSGLTFSIVALGIWNLILFSPLILTMSYIVISLVRGSS